MGVLKGLKNAQVFTKDPFFLVGTYRTQVKQVKIHTSEKDGNVMFIISAKIIKSNVPARPVGMTCAQVIKVTGNVSALGNIKEFVAVCIDADVNDPEQMAEIDEEMLEQLIEGGDFENIVLDLECTEKLTQKNKQPFTVHRWTLVKEAA